MVMKMTEGPEEHPEEFADINGLFCRCKLAVIVINIICQYKGKPLRPFLLLLLLLFAVAVTVTVNCNCYCYCQLVCRKMGASVRTPSIRHGCAPLPPSLTSCTTNRLALRNAAAS